jgi:hypothetical protein
MELVGGTSWKGFTAQEVGVGSQKLLSLSLGLSHWSLPIFHFCAPTWVCFCLSLFTFPHAFRHSFKQPSHFQVLKAVSRGENLIGSAKTRWLA